MSFELDLNSLYTKIAQQVNDMIPVEWDNFYFNGEVKEKDGGVFFFFTPKGENQYVFSHYIPKFYSVDKRTYNKELHKLFELTGNLQQIFIDNDQEPWFSVTLIVKDESKLNVYFDYTNWLDSEFGPTDRIRYFEHKHVNKNKEQQESQLIDKMKEFEEK